MSEPGEMEAVIGLEVHAQLRTRTKMFCGCPNRFGDAPNTLTCPVCLGLPGSLPVVNHEAIRMGMAAALALGGTVASRTRFDRKQYFYPDLPKNYQISQYDRPLAEGGVVSVETESGTRTVRLKRLHLEEDAGKLVHDLPEGKTGADLNRAGVPLIEIVTEPDLHTPEEAYAYLGALKEILLYLDVSDCEMQEGSLRCDANISIRPAGSEKLGTRAEIKNLNSFRGVQQALAFEIRRQTQVVASGGTVEAETRSWDAGRGETLPLRTKEGVHDYRYFPEPDLPPVTIEADRIARARERLPELPTDRRRRFRDALGISDYDAGVLCAEKGLADYFEACLAAFGDGTEGSKPLCNWITGPVKSVLNERNLDAGALVRPDSPVRLPPASCARLVGLFRAKTLTRQSAQEVFLEILGTDRDPADVIEEKGLAQVHDASELEGTIDEILAAHPKAIEDFRKGKTNAVAFLVGQVMRATRGKANPNVARETIERKLGG